MFWVFTRVFADDSLDLIFVLFVVFLVELDRDPPVVLRQSPYDGRAVAGGGHVELVAVDVSHHCAGAGHGSCPRGQPHLSILFLFAARCGHHNSLLVSLIGGVKSRQARYICIVVGPEANDLNVDICM